MRDVWFPSRFGDNEQFALNVAQWLWETPSALAAPEPATVALTATGLALVAALARRRARRA